YGQVLSTASFSMKTTMTTCFPSTTVVNFSLGSQTTWLQQGLVLRCSYCSQAQALLSSRVIKAVEINFLCVHKKLHSKPPALASSTPSTRWKMNNFCKSFDSGDAALHYYLFIYC